MATVSIVLDRLFRNPNPSRVLHPEDLPSAHPDAITTYSRLTPTSTPPSFPGLDPACVFLLRKPTLSFHAMVSHFSRTWGDGWLWAGTAPKPWDLPTDRLNSLISAHPDASCWIKLSTVSNPEDFLFVPISRSNPTQFHTTATFYATAVSRRIAKLSTHPNNLFFRKLPPTPPLRVYSRSRLAHIATTYFSPPYSYLVRNSILSKFSDNSDLQVSFSY